MAIITKSAQTQVDGEAVNIFYILGVPIFIAIGFLSIFVRPIYILSLFDIYSEYMIEINQKITAPKKNPFAKIAVWFFIFLILLIASVIIFREELGIVKLLATPYN